MSAVSRAALPPLLSTEQERTLIRLLADPAPTVTAAVADRLAVLDHLRQVKKFKAKVQRIIVDVDPASML